MVVVVLVLGRVLQLFLVSSLLAVGEVA